MEAAQIIADAINSLRDVILGIHLVQIVGIIFFSGLFLFKDMGGRK